ncbi:MAG: hypothetical protein FWC03_13145, partial [Treponema sp.]|nr:hypothetical protein [Treponema sp.]
KWSGLLREEPQKWLSRHAPLLPSEVSKSDDSLYKLFFSKNKFSHLLGNKLRYKMTAETQSGEITRNRFAVIFSMEESLS